jgi:two-component system sensor histidine kinase and response regulator WspE
MTPFDSEDLSHLSMMDLFRLETETQSSLLEEGLLALERNPEEVHRFEVLMRAAHSLKGAARLVNIEPAVRVAHAMEDCFVAAQDANIPLTPERTDVLLKGVDLLNQLANLPDIEGPLSDELNLSIEQFLKLIAESSPSIHVMQDGNNHSLDEVDLQKPNLDESVVVSATNVSPPIQTETFEEVKAETPVGSLSVPSTSAVVRVSADNINRLLRLAGESVVAAHWLETINKSFQSSIRNSEPLLKSLQHLKTMQGELNVTEQFSVHLDEMQSKSEATQQSLTEQIAALQQFERRLALLTDELYNTVLDCRMRPFADGVRGYPRMVRQVARSLGKEVNLEIQGESTLLDRDILERLEAPLGHLLRNAIDHGIEGQSERQLAGKPVVGQLKLSARHVAGQLLISLEDDGCGIDLDYLRKTLISRGLVTEEVGSQLSAEELTEFLFLPGFSIRNTVTDISGRGVGLDVVRVMVREVGGTVTIVSAFGKGTRFELRLPLTLSIVRTLLVEIAGEPFALPIARVDRVLKIAHSQVESIEGRQQFVFDGRQIGLVAAGQILGLPLSHLESEVLSVLIISDGTQEYGIIVNRFLIECELAVRPLDPRLGKVQDIAAAALMPDQSPVLIIDVDDFIQSIRRLTSEERLTQITLQAPIQMRRRKRILVVDDSLTVRELERKLIAGRGYDVEVAVDGMDAWNTLRSNRFDLVVTDVDMPRLDGIELTTRIKTDPRLQSIMVMIVSYKDREEDRRRGLEAGADYYLAKASFHDETLLTAVEDLIGGVEE